MMGHTTQPAEQDKAQGFLSSTQGSHMRLVKAELSTVISSENPSFTKIEMLHKTLKTNPATAVVAKPAKMPAPIVRYANLTRWPLVFSKGFSPASEYL